MAETSPPPRRFFSWRIAVLVPALLLVIWGVSSVAVRMVADSRWAGMKERWKALLEEARARDRSRPALRGEPPAGNAWDDYAVAIRDVRML